MVHDQELKQVFDNTVTLVDGIGHCPENLDILIGLVLRGSEYNEIVTKAAIHYDVLGDSRKFDQLREFLLKVERLEFEHPEIRWAQRVPNTLVGCFRGTHRKSGITFDERDLREWRVMAAYSIIEELIYNERGIMALGPLIAVTGNRREGIFAEELLEKMDGKRLGKADPAALKDLIKIGTAIIASCRRRIVMKMFGKIIEEGDNDLIYFVGPLVAASRNPDHGMFAEDLLEKMDGKRLGRPDPETINELGRTFRRTISHPKCREVIRTTLEKLRRRYSIEIDTCRTRRKKRRMRIN